MKRREEREGENKVQSNGISFFHLDVVRKNNITFYMVFVWNVGTKKIFHAPKLSFRGCTVNFNDFLSVFWEHKLKLWVATTAAAAVTTIEIKQYAAVFRETFSPYDLEF